MRYRNKATGREIDIVSELTSPDWEKVAPDGKKNEEAETNGNRLRKRKRHNSTGNKPDSSSK